MALLHTKKKFAGNARTGRFWHYVAMDGIHPLFKGVLKAMYVEGCDIAKCLG